MVQKHKTRPLEATLLTGRQFLNNQAKHEKVSLYLAVLAGVLATMLMLLQWLVFSFLSEKVIVNHELIQDQSLLIIVLIMCVIGRPLLFRMQTLLSQKASLNIRNSIRKIILKHWRTASPLLLKNTSTGAFASQFVEEVETMDGYFSRYWPQQTLAVISPLLILAVVTYLNWLCGLLLLISAPLIPFFMVLVGMGAEKLNQKYSTMRQRLSGHFLDRVSNLLTIRLLGAEKSVFTEVESNSNRYRKVIMKTLRVAFLSSTVLEFFTSVAIAALAIYIGFALYGAITWGPADSLSLFTGLTILILAPEFFQPLRNLSQFYHDRASALGAANNIVSVLMLSATATDSTAQVKNSAVASKQAQEPTLKNTQFTLNLSNLSIGHNNNSPLAKHLNTEISTGDMLVISGYSGTGKTSLLNTIANYLPPIQGAVLVSPTKQINMAYLPQNPWIKNDTIYANLTALAPNVPHAEMFKVLRLLGLVDELALDINTIDKYIGEHGQGLSGGQMQRIAFARVMLNPAPVILLDEPTAKLDAISKAYIIKALEALKPNSIIVIATHDLSLIDMCDKHIDLDLLEE